VGEIVIGEDSRRAIQLRTTEQENAHREYAFLMTIKKKKRKKERRKERDDLLGNLLRQQKSPRPSRPFIIANVSAGTVLTRD